MYSDKLSEQLDNPGRSPKRFSSSSRFARRSRLIVLGVTASLLLASLGLLLFVPASGSAASAASTGMSALTALAAAPRPLSPAVVPSAVTWSDFAPTGWVTATPASIRVTVRAPGGLVAGTAAYGVSTNHGATWTPWSTSGMTVDDPGSATQVVTVAGLMLPDSVSANLVRFRIQETGGALETSSAYPVLVDTAPPAAPQALQVSPAGWTNAPSFSVGWTNPPDPVGVQGAWYKLDAAPTGPNDGAYFATANGITGIVPSGDGIHPIYVWLQDQLGRADQTKAAMANLYWDRTPPAPPFGLQGIPGRTWTNVNNFTERWTNPSDLSGIAGVYYRINRPGAFPTDGIFINTSQPVASNIEMPADGKHDLYIWLVDAAGNVDQNNRNIDPQVFWFDATPPVSWSTLTPSPSASGWYSSAVTVVFAGTDGPGGSGLSEIRNRLDNGGWSTLAWVQVNGEGAHQLSYYAVDVANNLEPTHTITVPLDFTPPVVSLIPDRLPRPNGWYTAPVTISLAVTDTRSGSGGGFYQLNGGEWQSGGQIKLPTDGAYTIDYYGQDNAGNRSPLRSASIKLDATPPATAYLIEGAQGDGGWYTSPLNVRLIPSDSGSGVATTFYSINGGPWQTDTQFQITTDGNYSLSFYSIDFAGNVETSFPVQVKLDTVAPGAPAAVETNPAAWSRVNRFSVQWANPTDLSGIVGVYYRMETEPSNATDGVFSSQTNRLDNLAVPGEGAHRLYLWLRDGAGNADQRNRTVAPLLRYDATPPTTTLRIQGITGDNGWYRSPITVSLDALDLASGVAGTRYRLDSGAWLTGTSVTIATPDKHVLEYSSEDVAGNIEPTRQSTLRIDPVAPAAPINLRAGPSGWQRQNSFTLSWIDPLDQSGIAGAYVHFNGTPAGPTDGSFYPASQVLEGLQVPSEGKHDLNVWLRDRAGNADQATAIALPSALWYDGTPPSTTVSVSGEQGEQGWYVSPVTFTMSATDGTSGVKETRWQINDADWSNGSSFALDADGQFSVRIVSEDNAGNIDAPHVYQINIDRQPPAVRLGSLARYQTGERFDVTWAGWEPANASGLATFDVQVRDGYAGQWENWLTATTQTSATYQGQRGHTYFFRARARDRAGNEAAFTDGSTYAVIETVRNGDFATGIFSNWTASGILYSAVVPADGPAGGSSLMARLGSPIYGESVKPPGNVPVGDATIQQTIKIPTLTDVARPTLAFWYRVLSYDVLWSERLQRYVDDLEVSLRDTNGQQLALLLRAGNPTSIYGTLYDTGWHYVTVDLGQYAGQTVQLAFANHNREDNLFNTWSFVDNIQVQDWPYNQHVYLPLTLGGGAAASAAQAAPADANEKPAAPPEGQKPLPGQR